MILTIGCCAVFSAVIVFLSQVSFFQRPVTLAAAVLPLTLAFLLGLRRLGHRTITGNTPYHDLEMNIRVLNRAFEYFIRMTDNTINSLESISSSMEEQRLASETSSAAVTEMVASVESISQRMEEQSQIVDNFSAGTQEMAASISAASEKAQSTDHIAEVLTESASVSSRILTETVESINSVLNSSEQINRAVKIISDISEQTKRLANQSAANVQDITKSVEDVTKGIVKGDSVSEFAIEKIQE